MFGVALISLGLVGFEPAPLPPVPEWSGASEALAVAPEDPLATPVERSGFRDTPSYDVTVQWLRQLDVARPEIEMRSLGKSGEGRDLWMVVASRERDKSPESLQRSGKPIVLVQAGIHAGEIDGKDAGLMMLRDMTVRGTAARLLEEVHLLLIPIFNVDGHERSSPWNRMNQRGPSTPGWRTTARNLNLNRDYAKADAPEMRHLLQAIERWRPDLYVDVHVTDGADYRYDVTYGWNDREAWSPAIAGWLDAVLRPAVDGALERLGHAPGPLVLTVDPQDPSRGMYGWTAGPRYSNGYGDARHLPTVLVENHSLKPFRQRVLGTRVLLEAVLGVVAREHGSLRAAISQDRARREPEIVTAWNDQPAANPTTIPFDGIAWRHEDSPVSGGKRLVYTGEPASLDMPILEPSGPAASVRRPPAYWIPGQWDEIIDRLALHGIRMDRLTGPRAVQMDMYRIDNPDLSDNAYEGRVTVQGAPRVERRTEILPAGSARVPTDQPLGTLAMLLLEPSSPDSFFRWGFFLEILQRTEYFEPYVMEALGARMLADDAALRAAFEKRLAADSAFAADPDARLRWLYDRSPYHDDRFRLYPVGREIPAAAP